ncbi:MAG TPA: GtrA family protein [Burkholderiaceae bacterium]|nr:GtrA family protein [Burkholderiaceae bacterium]
MPGSSMTERNRDGDTVAGAADARVQRRELGLFARYFFFGSCAVGVNLVVLTLLIEGFGVYRTVASVCGFLTSVAVNFLLQRRYTFRSNTPLRTGGALFLGFALATLALNTLIFDLLSRHIHYLPAQMTAAFLMFLVNYQLNRRFTFRR